MAMLVITRGYNVVNSPLRSFNLPEKYLRFWGNHDRVEISNMEPSNCYFQQEHGGKKSRRYVSSLGATLLFNRINQIQGVDRVGQTQKKHIRQSLAMYNLLIYQVQIEGGSYKMDKLMTQITGI